VEKEKDGEEEPSKSASPAEDPLPFTLLVLFSLAHCSRKLRMTAGIARAERHRQIQSKYFFKYIYS